jgi:hypothetical protein
MTWYLRTHYRDPQRGEVRQRQYLYNGEVWVVVDGDRSLLCRFDPDQSAAARSAVSTARLDELTDIPATTADLAIMTYEWNVDGSEGRWVDAAYPRVLPDNVDRLEEALLRLEEGAG